MPNMLSAAQTAEFNEKGFTYARGLFAPDEIKLLTELYVRETYSAHPVSRAERVLAVRVWRKLFWKLL